MKNRCFFLFFGIFFGLLFLASRAETKPLSDEYDILLKNGYVLDGSLKPAFKADVAIKAGIIIEVAPTIQGKASHILDVSGLHISPGFIDMHSHADEEMYFPENRAVLNFLTQGVTTLVTGNCGFSSWPYYEMAEDQINRWTKEGIGPNVALMVGHGTVRSLVMGMENRDPTAEELEKMKALVKEAMEQGACGLSSGLIYLPGTYGKTAELIELSKVIAPYGGIYLSHIREEQNTLVDAVREAIEISDKSGAPADISHFKVMGQPYWGLVKEACALIEQARARGLKIWADQYTYPYPGSPYQRLIPLETWMGKESCLEREDYEKLFSNYSDAELIDFYSKVTPYYPLSERHLQFLRGLSRNRLIGLVIQIYMRGEEKHGPDNIRERELFIRRLEDAEEAKKIRYEVKKYIEERQAPGVSPVSPENWFVALCVEKELEGKSLTRIAALKKKPVEDVAIELELMGAKCVPFEMSEKDIEYIVTKDYVATGSDGSAHYFGIGLPHIRGYSTFLFKIKEYALSRKVISLEHAIRSQTSLPAEIMGWKDRGRIKEGYVADIAVLDLKNIETPATLQNPHQYCKGVQYLLVNGKLVIEKGQWNGSLAGQVIKVRKSQA